MAKRSKFEKAIEGSVKRRGKAQNQGKGKETAQFDQLMDGIGNGTINPPEEDTEE